MPGSDVLGSITSFLIGKGLTPAQVAGVEGNLYVESKFNPSAANAAEGAIGLAQWEGPRRTALQRFARSQGRTETDLTTQLNFLWSELTGPESAALAALKRAGTPAAAASVFDQQYERSSGGSRQARTSAANDIYTGVTLPNGSSTTGGSGGSGGGSSTLDKLAHVFVPGYGAIDAAGGGVDTVVSSWAGEALAIGIKLLGSVGAIALVVAGVMHTVKDGN
jgi:hydroxymethylglutaryl-CoA reductase